jgi:hypothetical protein
VGLLWFVGLFESLDAPFDVLDERRGKYTTSRGETQSGDREIFRVTRSKHKKTFMDSTPCRILIFGSSDLPISRRTIPKKIPSDSTPCRILIFGLQNFIFFSTFPRDRPIPSKDTCMR